MFFLSTIRIIHQIFEFSHGMVKATEMTKKEFQALPLIDQQKLCWGISNFKKFG